MSLFINQYNLIYTQYTNIFPFLGLKNLQLIEPLTTNLFGNGDLTLDSNLDNIPDLFNSDTLYFINELDIFTKEYKTLKFLTQKGFYVDITNNQLQTTLYSLLSIRSYWLSVLENSVYNFSFEGKLNNLNIVLKQEFYDTSDNLLLENQINLSESINMSDGNKLYSGNFTTPLTLLYVVFIFEIRIPQLSHGNLLINKLQLEKRLYWTSFLNTTKPSGMIITDIGEHFLLSNTGYFYIPEDKKQTYDLLILSIGKPFENNSITLYFENSYLTLLVKVTDNTGLILYEQHSIPYDLLWNFFLLAYKQNGTGIDLKLFINNSKEIETNILSIDIDYANTLFQKIYIGHSYSGTTLVNQLNGFVSSTRGVGLYYTDDRILDIYNNKKIYSSTKSLIRSLDIDASTLGGLLPSEYSTLSHSHDGRYYTKGEQDSQFVNTSGDTMTGELNIPSLKFDSSNVMYVGGSEILTIRNWGDEPSTIFSIRSLSPKSWKDGLGLTLHTIDREATLALIRTDDLGNEEFLDIYNNGYNNSTNDDAVQYGIRIQKRGTGQYRDFVIDRSDGTTNEHILTIDTNKNINIDSTINLNNILNIGNNSVSSEQVTFDGSTSIGLRLQNTNGYINLTPLNTGWLHIYTDRSNFIFNKTVYSVENSFSSYNNDLQLQRLGTNKITVKSGQVNFVDPIYIGSSKLATEPWVTSNFLGINLNAVSLSKLYTLRTISLSGDITGSLTFDGTSNISISALVTNDSHTHDSRYYTETELDSRFINLSGDTMTGNLTFTNDQQGLIWSRNTDGASIKFYNTLDGDTNSRLEFDINDNGNEFFRWVLTLSGTTTELMKLVPNNTNNGLTYRGNTVWHLGNDGSGSGLDLDLLDGMNSSSSNLLNTIVFRDLSGNFSANSINLSLTGNVNGNLVGNASTLTKLETLRVISVAGDISGSLTFDGSLNISISLTVSNDSHSHSNSTITSVDWSKLSNVPDPTITLSGDITGLLTMTNLGSIAITTTVADDSHTHDTRYYTETEADSRFVNVAGDTITGLLTFSGNTIFNNTMNINSEIRVENSNPSVYIWNNLSGVLNLYFGENSSSGYGLHLYWDSSYTTYLKSRHLGVDTNVFHINTSNLDFVLDQPLISTYGENGGLYIGTNGSKPQISTVNGNQMVVRTNEIRFSDSTSWDYDLWAGIKYDSINKKMYIGGPNSSHFTSSTNPQNLDVEFDGVNDVKVNGTLTIQGFSIQYNLSDESFDFIYIG